MKRYVFICLVSLVWMGAMLAQETKTNPQIPSIVETVTVKNVKVAVRVYDGKKPVAGLKKEYFRLLVNGEPREINGFFTLRKEIKANTGTQDSASPAPGASARQRLFVLLFNVAGYRQDLADTLDYFFKTVLRPRDRLMVMTNHYYFPQWKIGSPERTKAEILKLLDKEKHRLRGELKRFEMELKAQAAMLKSDVAAAIEIERNTQNDMSIHISNLFKNFFLTYRFVLEDLRGQFLDFPADHYIKIARYLQGRQGDKWVINFFQVSRLPMLDQMGELFKTLDFHIERGIGGGGDRRNASRQIQTMYMEFLAQAQGREAQILKDISKAFLNSGATFHTMLINPMINTFSTDFKYMPVSSNTEILLKKLTRLTGGSVLSSNKIGKFVDRIATREDIVYTLTYVPPADTSKSSKIKIKIFAGEAPNKKNKKYRLVYDDQDRIKAFKKAEKKIDRLGPDLEIQKLVYYNQSLIVKLDNIKLMHYDGKDFGAVQARVKVLDKHSKTVAGFQKVFKGISGQGMFQAALPKLPRGKYNVVLEVKDLFSLDDKYTGDAIDIKVN
jgi:hypothetical protein